MPETRVIAKAVPKEDQKEKVKPLLRDMIAPSLAKPGVRAYDLHETRSARLKFRPPPTRHGT